MSSLKQKVVKGTFWAFAERLSTQAVSFVVTLVLARLLTPDNYGTVALMAIFTSIARVLVDSGFGNALIQKKNVTELDFNSVFYLSLALSTIMYLVLFLAAPLIARFYKMPELVLMLRVISALLFCNAINSVQNAELYRKMQFHLSFRISLISTVVSGVAGVSFAVAGFGAWALIWSQITGGVANVLTRWYYVAWRPKIMFSFSALRPLFAYGWKLTVSELLNTGFRNLYGLVIGKYYSKADLAYVNKGYQLPELLMNNVNRTLGVVAFPALAQMQDNHDKLRESMRKMMIVSTYIVFPMMAFLAIVAKNVIYVLFGNQWSFCVPYMQLACFSFALYPFHTINLQGIQAIGRSDMFLKLEIIKKTISLIVLVVFIPLGVFHYMMATAFLLGPLSVVINAWPNQNLLGYKLVSQIKDIIPTFMYVVIASIPVIVLDMFLKFSSLGSRITVMGLEGILFVMIFLGISFIFHSQPMDELFQILESRVSLKFGKLRWKSKR